MHQPQRLADLIPGVIDELIALCAAQHPFDDTVRCRRAPHGDLGHSADGTTWTDQPDEET